MKPIHREHPDEQNCSLSSFSPQLPTNEMLPKPPQPLQSYVNDCVYSSCPDGPEPTFNTKLKYSVNPGTRLGHHQKMPCRASKPGGMNSRRKQSQRWLPTIPPLEGSLSAARAQQRGAELGCGRGGAESSQRTLPCLSKPHPQAAFQRDELRGKFIRQGVSNHTWNKHFLPFWQNNHRRRAGSLAHSVPSCLGWHTLWKQAPFPSWPG